MKIKTILGYSVLFMVFFSCESKNGSDEDLKDERIPDDLPKVYILADYTDILINKEWGGKDKTDGEFEFIENYVLNDISPPYFRSQSPFYKASYMGTGIHNPKINGSLMDYPYPFFTNGEHFLLSSSWNLEGKRSDEIEFKWEYISPDKKTRYCVEMNDIPHRLTIIDYPEKISSNKNIEVTFEKEVPLDSVYFSIVYVPKANFENYPKNRFLFGRYTFPNISEGNKFIISNEDFFPYLEISDTDSVFISLVSVKRVIKEIGNEKMGITYKRENMVPITIEK